MSVSDSLYLTFIEIAMELVSVVPPYSSKFSKRKFTQQQLFVLLVLKQKLKLSYDMLIEDMKTREGIMLMLGLQSLPCSSTLKKFAKRIKSSLLENLLGSCINLTRKKKLNVGIDATGFHIEDGSYHYRKRLGKHAKVRKNVKLSIAVDTDKQLILATKIRKNKAHDTKDFKPLLKKVAKIKPVKIVVADKGYDAETNHKFCHEILYAECIIPPRNENVPIHRTKGQYRKQMKKNYSKKKYHQRNLVETINFVIKKFGTTLHAKKWYMQTKELLFRLLTYNIHRLVKLRISP